MLLKSFVLDHVKEGGIFILETVMFQHGKIQGLWLSNSFRNGNSCSLSVQGKLWLWGPVQSSVLVAPWKLHFWAQWPSELWAIKRQGTKNPLISFSSGCFTCSGRHGSSGLPAAEVWRREHPLSCKTISNAEAGFVPPHLPHKLPAMSNAIINSLGASPQQGPHSVSPHLPKVNPKTMKLLMQGQAEVWMGFLSPKFIYRGAWWKKSHGVFWVIQLGTDFPYQFNHIILSNPGKWVLIMVM